MPLQCPDCAGGLVVVVDGPMLMVRLGWLVGPLGIGSTVGVLGTVVMVVAGRHEWW